MSEKAIIAMSGGVDSSVAALLMKNSGYECIGATMKLYTNEDAGVSREKGCCSLSDVEDAKSVAHRLGMLHYVFNFTDKFRECVIDRFVKSYENGQTPNPCIDCNRYLKFDKMLLRMKEIDFDYIVTGHYARVEYDENTGKYLLKKAVDSTKDQSYVLYMLTQEQLAHIKFPLGAYTKKEIRKIAEENNFVTAHKSDSQDICFVPDGDYASFIERYLGKYFPQGDFVLRDGTVLGKHKGIIHYTLGQRKGLGVSYTKPLFVCEINTETNNVVLGDNADLFTDTLKADRVNIISGEDFSSPVRCKAKIRYKHEEQPATAFVDGNGILNVKFDEPQRAVTKGQAVVLYDGDTVLGGGEIL
ncbi:MAG: tRNA 2-thiouridine(34) synthase MnmA [Oscillospiraceae bacterium]|nr:tRNA 2-thiouridine(34) synthase MnmA [Oscillospiraceae bacterium]